MGAQPDHTITAIAASAGRCTDFRDGKVAVITVLDGSLAYVVTATSAYDLDLDQAAWMPTIVYWRY
jgi:hypothetical protein